MSTSQSSQRRTTTAPGLSLRLVLKDRAVTGSLDGIWWPQSRDIAVEVRDLVNNFPDGRISRVLFSRPDWDTHPRTVQLGGRRMKTGSFPSDDTHLIVLTMTDHAVLRLLIVPPDHAAGELLMRLDLAGLDHHDARALLATGGAASGFDPADQWNDAAGSWWHPHPTPPSFRTGRPDVG